MKQGAFFTLFVVLLACGGSAMGVIAEDYVAIHLLEPPADHPPLNYQDNCSDFVEDFPNQLCGAGPAHPGGISNAGDVFGQIESNFPHIHHNEQAIRWLRSTGYEPENIGRGADEDSSSSRGIHLDGKQGGAGGSKGVHIGCCSAEQGRGKLTSEGIYSSQWNVDNFHIYHYDINTNVFTGLGPGIGVQANNLGRVPAISTSCCGNYPATIHDINAISEENPTGLLQELNADPWAINDNDIIVGKKESNPIKMVPIGIDQWSDPINLDQLGPAFLTGQAVDISNTDPGIAVGTSFGFDGPHGVVWDVNSGNIIADLGSFTAPDNINSAGTMAVGLSGVFDRVPVLWTTDDGWENFQAIPLNDILAVVPGAADIWAEITSVAGVNDAGQVVGKGTLVTLVDPGATAWAADIATGEECGSPQVGTPSRNGCGVPFILDTQGAGGGIKGDVNNDSVVDFLDITPFINAQSAEGDEGAFLLLTPDGCFLCADIDMDGVVDFLDITPYVNLLDEVGAATVPEPAVLAVLAMFLMMPRRTRKRIEG